MRKLRVPFKSPKIKSGFIMVLLTASIFFLTQIFTTSQQVLADGDGLLGWLFGDTNKDALKFIQDHPVNLNYIDLFSYIWSKLVWGVIKGLYLVAEWARQLINDVFSIGNLMSNSEIYSTYSSFVAAIGWSLMVIALVWYAIKHATEANSNGTPSVPTVMRNLIVSVVVLISAPAMINSLYSVSTAAFGDIAGSQSDSVAASIIKNNTNDLFYMAQNDGFKNKDSDTGNKNAYGQNAWNKGKTSIATFMQTDMSQTLNKDDVDKIVDGADKDKIGEQFKNLKYMIQTGDDGNLQAVEIPDDDGVPFIDVFKPGYARFPANRMVIIMGLIGTAIAYLIIAVSILVTLIELPLKAFAGSAAVATDLESGQRTKMVINDVFQSFMLIFWSGVELYFYGMIVTIVGNLKNPFIVGLGYIAATYVLWKGSSAVAKYFGIDTGLKKGLSPLMAAVGAGAAMKRMTSGFKGGINKIRGNQDQPLTTNGTGMSDGDEGGSATSNPHMPNRAMNAIRNGAGSVSKAAGYLGNSSVEDVAGDIVDGAKTATKSVGKKIANAVTDPGGTVSAARDGYQEGKQTAKEKHEESPNEPDDKSVTNTPVPSNGTTTTDKNNDTGKDERETNNPTQPKGIDGKLPTSSDAQPNTDATKQGNLNPATDGDNHDDGPKENSNPTKSAPTVPTTQPKGGIGDNAAPSDSPVKPTNKSLTTKGGDTNVTTTPGDVNQTGSQSNNNKMGDPQSPTIDVKDGKTQTVTTNGGETTVKTNDGTVRNEAPNGGTKTITQKGPDTIVNKEAGTVSHVGGTEAVITPDTNTGTSHTYTPQSSNAKRGYRRHSVSDWEQQHNQ